MTRIGFPRVVAGGFLALALAWYAGPSLVAGGATLAQRAGADNTCTKLDCDDTNCGKHCDDKAGCCVYVDTDNPNKCSTGTGSGCNSEGTKKCDNKSPA